MTDANSAMAFFYRPLNSWVLSALHAQHNKNEHQHRYVPKRLMPCKIPADISNRYLQMESAVKTVMSAADVTR